MSASLQIFLSEEVLKNLQNYKCFLISSETSNSFLMAGLGGGVFIGCSETIFLRRLKEISTVDVNDLENTLIYWNTILISVSFNYFKLNNLLYIFENLKGWGIFNLWFFFFSHFQISWLIFDQGLWNLLNISYWGKSFWKDGRSKAENFHPKIPTCWSLLQILCDSLACLYYS